MRNKTIKMFEEFARANSKGKWDIYVNDVYVKTISGTEEKAEKEAYEIAKTDPEFPNYYVKPAGEYREDDSDMPDDQSSRLPKWKK
jgi:hypothetical protein